MEAVQDVHFIQMCWRDMWNCYLCMFSIILMKYPTYSDYVF